MDLSKDHALAHHKLKVMIVDDSAVIRGFLTRTLEADPAFVIVGTANNGLNAIRLLESLDADIVLLDIEMPDMDGLTALPHILSVRPTVSVIIVSTLSKKNAAISIQALARGAVDYLEKPSSLRNDHNLEHFKKELVQKIKTIGVAKQVKSQLSHPHPASVSPSNEGTSLVKVKPYPLTSSLKNDLSAIAIACSTGGPQALMTFFEGIKGRFTEIPIFITQHMPPTFTTFLADHLSKTSGRLCKEASEKEKVIPGNVYIAPGDFHLELYKEQGNIYLHLSKSPPENFCRPSADPMLRSLADLYGSTLLLIVLTGMGQDGKEGAKMIKKKGGMIIAQDEETSVVWGMPGAVANEGICKAVLPLPMIASYLIKEFPTAK